MYCTCALWCIGASKEDVLLVGGEQLLVKDWRVSELTTGRDENRRVTVSVLPREEGVVGKALFVLFGDTEVPLFDIRNRPWLEKQH